MGHAPLHNYFAAQLEGLARQGVLTPGAPLAIAVSGGPDSMALAQLCLDCAASQHPLHILTVDHGLRPESADEAAQVCAWAQTQGGVTAHQLHWQKDEEAGGNVQEQARLGRYALMAQWCVDNEVDLLLTAHHQDDQAETVLMRLGRGSGVDGLSAMRGRQQLQTAAGSQVTLLRPLLGVPKQALVQFANSRKLPTVNDPSNHAQKYARSRHRAFLSSEEAEGLGLSVQRLTQTARTMQRAADALDAATDKLATQLITAMPLGYLKVQLAPLFAEEEELRLRLMRLVIGAFNPGTFPIEEEQLLRLWQWVIGRGIAGQGADAPRYTIRGLLLEKAGATDDPSLFVMREPRAIAQPVQLCEAPCVWDGRFALTGDEGGGGNDLWCLPVAALGINKVRDELTGAAAAQFAAAPPMARGTVPALATIGDDGEARMVGLLTDKGGFRPFLQAKTPLILPESQKFEGESPK